MVVILGLTVNSVSAQSQNGVDHSQANLESILNNVVERARDLCIDIEAPEIKVESDSSYSAIWFVPDSESSQSFIEVGSNITGRPFVREELEVLLAHELGHAVDLGDHAVDGMACGSTHPFLRSIHDMDLSPEDFANVFAAYLYSPQRVVSTARSYESKTGRRGSLEYFTKDIMEKIDFTVQGCR